MKHALAAEAAIVEGEALEVDQQGRPLPFQHLMRRFRRKHALAQTVAEIPVQLHRFDALGQPVFPFELGDSTKVVVGSKQGQIITKSYSSN